MAIATVTAISLFTSRIEHSVIDEASHLLAGDAKISGSLPIDEQWEEKAEQTNLRTAQYINFSSMLFFGDEMILAQIKAVDSHYPLKGQLKSATQPYQTGTATTRGPQPGKIWLTSRLFESLNIQIGDSLALGEATFQVSAVLTKEPDSGQSLFGVAPRAMVHINDVEKTQVVQAGSRISYALLVAGKKSNLAVYQQWLTPHIGHHHKWQDVESGNRSVGDALQRAKSFLLLAGSLGVILGGVAVALCARRYANKQSQTVALLKTLGCTPRDISIIYITLLITLGLITMILGGFLGWLLHWGILAAIGNLIQTQLSAPSFDAYWIGSITGIVALIAFASPPLLNLRKVLPAAALNDQYRVTFKNIATNLIGFIAILLLVYLYSQNITLTLYLTLGAVTCLGGVYILSWLTIKLINTMPSVLKHSWRLGV